MLIWAFREPVSPGLDVTESASTRQESAPTSTHVTRPLSDFAAVWERPLAAPLYDTAIETKPAKKKRPKSRRNKNNVVSGVRLVGTVLESGRSLAVLADSSGHIHLRGVGEAVDLDSGMAEVESIEFQKVSLTVNGKLLTLSMQ